MKINAAAQEIRSFFDTHKRIPSYQEMCTLFGYASKKASFELAKKLIEAGILEKDTRGKLVLKDISLTLLMLIVCKKSPKVSKNVAPQCG